MDEVSQQVGIGSTSHYAVEIQLEIGHVDLLLQKHWCLSTLSVSQGIKKGLSQGRQSHGPEQTLVFANYGARVNF